MAKEAIMDDAIEKGKEKSIEQLIRESQEAASVLNAKLSELAEDEELEAVLLIYKTGSVLFTNREMIDCPWPPTQSQLGQYKVKKGAKWFKGFTGFPPGFPPNTRP
jgi:hypothetical protein